jgi:hypothetical protein
MTARKNLCARAVCTAPARRATWARPFAHGDSRTSLPRAPGIRGISAWICSAPVTFPVLISYRIGR